MPEGLAVEKDRKRGEGRRWEQSYSPSKLVLMHSVAIYVYPSNTLAFPPEVEIAVSTGMMWSAELIPNAFVGSVHRHVEVVVAAGAAVVRGVRNGFVATAEEGDLDRWAREK
jgi:hypothetical protein